MGEQFWGEILERTYSMNNMNFSETVPYQVIGKGSTKKDQFTGEDSVNIIN